MKRWVLGLMTISWLGIQAMSAPSADIKPRSTHLSQSSPQSPVPSRQSFNCPADIETLIILLLRDLPSYANRAAQRARRLARRPDISSNILLAGRPEFESLTLGPGQYTPTDNLEKPQQVFITTWERQYTAGKPIELEQYHWLFLTQTDRGWQLAMMFTRTSPDSDQTPITPPRDSTNSAIGQGVRLWLRDCAVGTVRPLSGISSSPAERLPSAGREQGSVKVK